MGKSTGLSLYQTILGTNFNKLPQVFQTIHGTALPQKAEGEMTVIYGKGWLAQLCAPFMPIPPKGTCPLMLEIRKHKKGEEWIRSFPKHTMRSIQYIQDGIFYEQFGISYFSFKLMWEDEQLCFLCQKQYLGIFPVPTFLMVKPSASARAVDENSWKLIVKIMFLGKLLAKYEGHMTIRE